MRALINRSKLHPTIRPNWYDGDFKAIEESIEEEGLLYPIVTWETTVGEWDKWASQSKDLIGPNISIKKNKDMPVFLVMCGNNRLFYAEKHNYTLIDCVVCTNLNDVSSLCKYERKAWNESS